MTSATIHAAGPGLPVEEAAGPLEQRHLQYAKYRAVAEGYEIVGENASFGSGLAQRAHIAAQS
jgi:hypothetical protein